MGRQAGGGAQGGYTPQTQGWAGIGGNSTNAQALPPQAQGNQSWLGGMPSQAQGVPQGGPPQGMPPQAQGNPQGVPMQGMPSEQQRELPPQNFSPLPGGIPEQFKGISQLNGTSRPFAQRPQQQNDQSSGSILSRLMGGIGDWGSGGFQSGSGSGSRTDAGEKYGNGFYSGIPSMDDARYGQNPNQGVGIPAEAPPMRGNMENQYRRGGVNRGGFNDFRKNYKAENDISGRMSKDARQMMKQQFQAQQMRNNPGHSMSDFDNWSEEQQANYRNQTRNR
jgi:hypothetical protein